MNLRDPRICLHQIFINFVIQKNGEAIVHNVNIYEGGIDFLLYGNN
jgi:hypothetical protein